MTVKKIRFASAAVNFYFDAGMGALRSIADPKKTVLITDEHVYEAHRSRFRGWEIIVIPAGEASKVQATVDHIIQQLLGLGATRETVLAGVGGGVVTDITGYVASIYMRGISFGFIPTTVLALVDASIGGKNGIDVGPFKNMVGTIRQPLFILHDPAFLKTLPPAEWSNGFAEIIKHACIGDAPMFRKLEAGSLQGYMKGKKDLELLIRRNALLKAKVVQGDEWETGSRRLLNFGHTLGHAIENSYGLMHGSAVAVGMAFACHLSKKETGFRHEARVKALLEQYGLPTAFSFDAGKVMEVLQKDKKRAGSAIRFVLLEKIGRGVLSALSLSTLEEEIACWPS